MIKGKHFDVILVDGLIKYILFQMKMHTEHCNIFLAEEWQV